MVSALQAPGGVIIATRGSSAGCNAVSTPAATSVIAAVTTGTQNSIIRRADSAPPWAESSSLWNSSSSTATGSTRATRSRYSSVATRNTFGSSRPVRRVRWATGSGRRACRGCIEAWTGAGTRRRPPCVRPFVSPRARLRTDDSPAAQPVKLRDTHDACTGRMRFVRWFLGEGRRLRWPHAGERTGQWPTGM